MIKFDLVFDIAVEFLRSLLIEVVSQHVRNASLPRKLRGMNEVRRHVHRTTQRRLLNRLSTGRG